MFIKRALYYWQFAAAIVLPAWVLIARGIFGSTSGWTFVFFVFVCPILALAMLAVAGLTAARKSVRSARAVEWRDAAVIVAWHVAIIAYGFVDASWLAAVIVIIAIGAFWLAVYLLFHETRRRVRGVMAGFEQAAQVPKSPSGGAGGAQDGRVIILEPGETRREP